MNHVDVPYRSGFSEPYRFLLEGRLACFTNPLFRNDRCSYPVPTHSGLRGALCSVFGKMGMNWYVESVAVCKPIRWFDVTSNERKELHDPIKKGPVSVADRSGQCLRTTTYLYDVSYLATARMYLTPKQKHPLAVYEEMFLRHQDCERRGPPHFGRQECRAEWHLLKGNDPSPVGIRENLDLGPMFYDFLDLHGQVDHSTRKTSYFTHLRMDEGIIQYPKWGTVLSANVRSFNLSGATP